MLQRSWYRTARRWRFPLFAVLDAALWFVTLYIAALARLGFEPSRIDASGYLRIALVASFVQITVGTVLGLYRGRRTIASFDEVLLVTATSAAAGLTATLVTIIVGPPNPLPISAVMAAAAYQLLSALGARYSMRLVLDLATRSYHPRTHRTIIFGAGDAGSQIIRAIQRDPDGILDPVALLDDDPTKKRLRVRGVPVVGDRSAIASAAAKYGANTILLAIPSATQADLNEIADAALAADLTVKTLPPLSKLTRSSVGVGDIRNIEMSDFLNRDEVDIDMASVRSYIAGKRVLVTGAGGSIGSALCRKLRDLGPARLIMVDHNENALHALEMSLQGSALLTSPDLVLCDIRDGLAIRTLFESTHPQVVFHAAAHKHVTFLERFPEEGYKTNVEGTRNVLEAAAATGVERFVNVSTDKAADPINVLGKTKREAELLTAEMNDSTEGVFLSVRFGNVLGSNGSVVPTFVEQVMRGNPITVTDPEASRFFMTVEEAVLLVLQGGALGMGGDVIVLEMGEPVKILDLANRISHSLRPGETPNIVFTGLRRGEKLHEVLASTSDEPLPQPHPRLRRFRVSLAKVP